jgi:hypothetical protein
MGLLVVVVVKTVVVVVVVGAVVVVGRGTGPTGFKDTVKVQETNGPVGPLRTTLYREGTSTALGIMKTALSLCRSCQPVVPYIGSVVR